jgi:SAM-dependent methyltransferase
MAVTDTLIEPAAQETAPTARRLTECPVCGGARWTFLSPTWRDGFLPGRCRIDDSRWFAECARCATVVMLPLVECANVEEHGKCSDDRRAADETSEEHALRHFNESQRPNDENVLAFLRRTHPVERYPRWLDVGSAGCPTTFDDYAFTTSEPEPRAVAAGRRRFQNDRIHCATIDTWLGGRDYDGILFNDSFCRVTTPGEALDAAHAALRPGGRLIITLSGYLNGAVSDRVDGQLLLIEDVLFGETMEVYYNEHCLQYLAARHGFRFVETEVVPAYGCKAMRAYVFERVEEREADLEWLDRSRACMQERWDGVFDGFRQSIVDTLAAINTPQTLLAGSLTVVRDLQRYGDLSQVRGFLPVPDLHLRGAWCGAIPIVSADDLKTVPPHTYEVAVCAFREPALVAAEVRHSLGPRVRVRMPTRRSGMEFIDFSFCDGLYPSKGFVLGPATRPAPPEGIRVNPARSSMVLFGAGEGGRQFLARLRSRGLDSQVVAFCDNDTTRVGTTMDGIPVRRLADVGLDEFDAVIITSVPGRTAIARQLEARGLVAGESYDVPSCLDAQAAGVA